MNCINLKKKCVGEWWRLNFIFLRNIFWVFLRFVIVGFFGFCYKFVLIEYLYFFKVVYIGIEVGDDGVMVVLVGWEGC